ncbi:MAG TPA: hypothetical protein D7H82_02295 [Candidatus Poseidoniales archaeon]|nr:MAG TPA: hypothetical protein D7H82_02295 [Candidatus Poseidoniales archaeon]
MLCPVIAMARGRATRKGIFTRWWESKKDSHFQIVTYVTILSCASMLWGFIFLFILGGASDPSHQDRMVPFSWLCLVGGSLISFYTLPEFGYYWSQRGALEEILALDARTEVLRRRKEAEDAAAMLGPKYQSRLMGLYANFQIRGGKRFKVEPSPPKNFLSKRTPLEKEKIDYEWWQTEDSRLSYWLPGLHSLKLKKVNRTIIVLSASAILLLSLNTIFGISIGPGGMNNDTIDLSAYILSMDRITFSPPHLDSVSLLLIAFFSIILDLTKPLVKFQEEE